MRRAAKVDKNHAEIVDALRKSGWLVLSLAAVGKGCVDILAYHLARDELKMVEVKDGSKPPSKQKLTPDQVYFHSLWPVTIVRSIEEALAL